MYENVSFREGNLVFFHSRTGRKIASFDPAKSGLLRGTGKNGSQLLE